VVRPHADGSRRNQTDRCVIRRARPRSSEVWLTSPVRCGSLMSAHVTGHAGVEPGQCGDAGLDVASEEAITEELTPRGAGHVHCVRIESADAGPRDVILVDTVSRPRRWSGATESSWRGRRGNRARESYGELSFHFSVLRGSSPNGREIARMIGLVFEHARDAGEEPQSRGVPVGGRRT